MVVIIEWFHHADMALYESHTSGKWYHETTELGYAENLLNFYEILNHIYATLRCIVCTQRKYTLYVFMYVLAFQSKSCHLISKYSENALSIKTQFHWKRKSISFILSFIVPLTQYWLALTFSIKSGERREQFFMWAYDDIWQVAFQFEALFVYTIHSIYIIYIIYVRLYEYVCLAPWIFAKTARNKLDCANIVSSAHLASQRTHTHKQSFSFFACFYFRKRKHARICGLSPGYRHVR